MPLFISDEEFSRLSGNTATVAVRADAYIRGVLHELDTVRAKADAADINAEQNCSLIEQRYFSLTAEFSKLESNASNLQSSLDQCLRDLSGVQAQNHQIHLQSVREMNLLRESNMQLREENRHNFEECQKMRELAQKARAETENLENLLREREIELESRKKEIEALKTEKDHLNHKVSGNELKAKWEDEKAILEKSKNDAEKKYDEISEQNKILHSRLETLRIQWAETERNAAFFAPGGGGDIFGVAGLHNIFNYLCRSEEIEETGVPLLELEKLRLQPQVREMNLLRGSNMQFREENKHNFEECQKMRELAQKARAETEILENLLRETEIELESRKKEIEALKTEKDHLNHKNELKAKWEYEKAILEKSKNDAEKKYDEISEQNKILHSRLETLRIQWAEIEHNAAFFAPGGGGDIFGDAGLHNIFNYLYRSEEIEETGVPLLELEKLRLQPQLESAFKVAESTHASLEAERAKARSFLFTEEEFKSLQLQFDDPIIRSYISSLSMVREMNLLRESNMQLREENKHNFEECQKSHELAQKARAETENLENLLREREVKLESLKKEIELLKPKKDHLNHKLLETSKNVGAEDYDRVKKLVRGLQLEVVEELPVVELFDDGDADQHLGKHE